MPATTYKKGDLIYKKGDKIKEMGLIVQGSVRQVSSLDVILLEKGHMVGMAGCDSNVYPADYVANENTVLSTYDYRGPQDLMDLFRKSSDYGSVFILAALKQAEILLKHYLQVKKVAREFYNVTVAGYRDYKYLCSKYSVPEYNLQRMEYLTAMDNTHEIASWKENYYEKFVGFGLDDLKDLFTCNELCVGTIMQAGAFMADMIVRTDEYMNYLEKSKSILLVDKKNDLFQLMFDLENRVAFVTEDKTELEDKMEKMISFIKESRIYDEDLMRARIDEYENFDFAAFNKDDLNDAEEVSVWEDDSVEDDTEDMDEQLTCLQQILRYAEFDREEIKQFEEKLTEYMDLPDRNSTEGDVRSIRRYLTEKYYVAYHNCVKTALTQGLNNPIIKMFLYFGFMDVTYAGGEDRANELLDLTDQIFACNMDGVFTFYSWLESIYLGQNEPSINELDLDYKKYIKEEVRNGNIPKDQENAIMEDGWSKVEFELNNLFKSGGKVTCGHITTFCPVLSDEDMLGSPESMLATAMKIRRALDEVRRIDYGLFYREVMFSDVEHGINREFINVEILPNFILMPNAGSKSLMWQPTAGAKNNTSARILMPIFCSASIDDMVLENCGRYRWEMCRKVQGSRWNDVTTPSLTSEYADYLQYYRKNSELSPEAKEKLHTALKRGRNNFREVFVKDYENWVRYESVGSFRLNKISRRILFTYIPFSLDARERLKDNPMFTEHINRFNVQGQKKLKRLNTLYKKYEEAGGEMTEDLVKNMEYLQM